MSIFTFIWCWSSKHLYVNKWGAVSSDNIILDQVERTKNYQKTWVSFTSMDQRRNVILFVLRVASKNSSTLFSKWVNPKTFLNALCFPLLNVVIFGSCSQQFSLNFLQNKIRTCIWSCLKRLQVF